MNFSRTLRRFSVAAVRLRLAQATVAVLLTLAGFVLTVQAASVHFDVPQLVSCQPVDDCDESVAGEELIEAVFEVSTLLKFGQESQVKQLLFVIESPAGLLEVVDYEPKTALTSSYVGHIERTRQQESSGSMGFSASFSPTELLSAQANTAHSAKTNESVRYQALPPLQLLAASGTAARGTAVYFKFKSTPQTTLDGSRPLRVVFRVPAGWRANYVYLRCVAFADPAENKHAGIRASHDFLVPLYREGDQQAKQMAARLAEHEYKLRLLARQSQHRIERSFDDVWNVRWVGLFRHPSNDKRAVPTAWLTTVLTSSPDQLEFSFEAQLPDELRQAVTDFTEARWQLTALNR